MDDRVPPATANRVLIPAFCAMPVSARGHARKVVLAGQAFATNWRVTAWTTQAEDGLQARCQAWLDLIDAQMSPYRDDSDLTRFNRAPSGSAIVLPQPMAKVVRYAFTMAELTGGAFDPCVLPAVELWGFGRYAVPPGLPNDDDIARLREGASWRDLAWHGDCLIQPGVRLDLCAIAKGFAVDGLMDVVRARPGVAAALVEIGGEVKGWGVQPDDLPWWVEVETPVKDRTLVALSGMAAATSGDGQRFFVHDGKVLSHTIDAATCAPVCNGVASITVFDPVCWRADALATALAVMGEARAMVFAAVHDIPCLLSLRDGSHYRECISPALEAWL